MRTPPASDEEFAQLLRDTGHRVTSPRLLIARLLRERGEHLSAEQIRAAVADRLPATAAPTIYATLELFERLGLVRRLDLGAGAALYDPRTDAHDHAICRRCGRVTDLNGGSDVTDATAHAREQGFAPEHAQVWVTGLCAACQASAPPTHERSPTS